MNEEKKFYVYGHFLLTGEVFYIGKGSGIRAYSRFRRNPHWYNKVKKYGGFDIVILQDVLTEEQSFEVEKSFIQSIGLKNLVNMTEGGEGSSGFRHSKESLIKISINSSGENNSMFGKHHSEESRNQISENRKGKCSGEAHHMFGKKHSEESRNKISEKLKGKNHPRFGKFDHPRFGKFGKDHCGSKSINQYSKDGEFIKNWDSIMDIERELRIDHSSISKCCKGKLTSAGGFLWKHV